MGLIIGGVAVAIVCVALAIVAVVAHSVGKAINQAEREKHII